MNLNYAIFRSNPIYTLNDLAQIGSHNKREKKAYNSNPDIKLELTKNNIELVPLNEKYVKGFHELVLEYEKEHNERMKTERDDRKKTFNQMINGSQNVVADELLFTATNKFFENMSKEDIKKWADTCMEFVYKDLGYTKNQVLHATVHMDEKTPHIHCVVVPLIKKYDKRTNSERYTISKKQYIRDKLHLSELQDKYHARLISKGYDLERGIKGSDRKHIPIREYKNINRALEQKINVRSKRLDKAMEDFNEKMKTTKNTIIDKDYVKVRKDTFDSMNNVIKETEKIIDLQPKINSVLEEINDYSKIYYSLKEDNVKYQKEIKELGRNNDKYQREIESLKYENEKLKDENKNLVSYINSIFTRIKQFFRQMLQKGSEIIKNMTCDEVKYYFDVDVFNDKDVYHISRGTSKENELFDHADLPNYLKEYRESSIHKKSKDDDFCL